MTISNGDVLMAFLELVLDDGTIAQNVFHWVAQFDEDQSDYDVKNAVETYIEDLYGAISTYLSDGFTINPSYLYKKVWDPTGAAWVIDELIYTFTPSFTHTNTDDPFPNQIAPVIVANTLRPKSRGRKFLMGFVETAADASDLVSGAVTALGTALNHYLADETVQGSNLLSPGVPREGVNTFLPFTDGAVNSVVGTQRRRKPGVGT
jgi:hypothetical protein